MYAYKANSTLRKIKKAVGRKRINNKNIRSDTEKIKEKNIISKEDIKKMRNYVALELKLLILEDEDVLTASADFTEAETGDNGVWFPGQAPSGKEGNWQ